MRKFVKYYLPGLILGSILFIATAAQAAPVSWDFASGVLQPLQSGWSALVKANAFQATSTTAINTFPNLKSTNASSTNATTTNQYITGLVSKVLKTDANGQVVGATAGTDYAAAGNYITALTGDVTATGPGSVGATLATVNGNVGSFTNANVTADAKGRITAISNGASGSGGSIGTSTPLVNGQVDFSTSANTIANDSTFLFDSVLKKLTITNASTTNLSIGSLSGLLKQVGGVVIAAVAGTDYENPLTFVYPLVRATNSISLAFGTTTSNTWAGTQTFTNVPVLAALTGTLNAINGTVYATGTSTPTVTAPITYSGTLGQFIGGVSGAFDCTAATGSVKGCLTAADWTLFNNKISSTSLSATSPIFYNSGTGVISSQAATAGQNGYLTSTDWSTFNGKENVLTFTYPLSRSTNTISLAFGTSSSNTWGGTQTFTNPIVNGTLSGLVSGNAGQTYATATSTAACTGASGVTCTSFPIAGPGGTTIALSAIPNSSLANSTISGVSLGGTLANLSATDSTLTFSGTYTGAAARTIGLNLGNANTWTALQTFANASSTLFSSSYASSTSAFFGTLNLPGITGTQCLQSVGGVVSGTGSACGSGGGTGLSTTSPVASSNLLYYNASGAGSATGVATSSATLNLGLSGLLTTIGSGQTLSIATSSLYTGTTGQFPYFSGTNTITATSSLFLAANGNIGIGSTTPFGKLSIDAPAGTAPYFNIGSSSGSVFTINPSASALLGIGTSSPYAALSIGGGNLVLGAASAGGTPGDLYLPKLGTAAGTFLAVDATGKVISTTTPAGGVSSVTGTYPVISSGGSTPAISLAFGTTTSNTWAGTQTFTNSPVFSTVGAGTVNSTSGGTIYNTATTSVSNGTGISFTGTAGALTGGSNLTITNSSPLSGLTATFPFSFSNPTLTWIGLATTSQPASSNILVSNGTNGIYGAATTTATCAGSVSCSTFNILGSTPVTITGSGGGGTGLSTTSPVASSNLLYYNASGAGSATGVATSSASLGLGLSGLLTTVGTGQTLSIATSSLYTGTTGQIPYFSGTNTITATSSVFLSTAGNLGIGTTTPSKLLYVLGDQAGGIARIHRMTSGTTGNIGALDFVAQSTGAAADTFGVGLNFYTADTATPTPTNVAVIATQRRGAVNTNDLIFGTSNAGAAATTMILRADGKLGVGTSIANSIASTITSNGNLAVGSSYATIAAPSNGAIILGNTGIGTSSPYAQLAIGGNVVVGASTAGGTLGDLYLPKLGAAAGTFLAVDSTGKVIATTTPAGSLTGTVGQTAYFSGTNTAVGTSTLTIDTTSRVGVGSTTPWAKLSVDAPAGTNPYFAIGSSTGRVFDITPSATTLVGVATTSPYATLSIGISSSTPALAIGVAGSSTPSLTILSANNNGRVGIGSSSPSDNFTVGVTSWFQGLARFFGNILLSASTYINFGTVSGTSGYGFFDNAGTMQFKNSGGSWNNIGTSSVTAYFATSTSDAVVTIPVVNGDVVQVQARARGPVASCSSGSISSDFKLKQSTFAASTTLESLSFRSTGGTTFCYGNTMYQQTATTTETWYFELVNTASSDDEKITAVKIK